MGSPRDAAFDAWVDDARAVPIAEFALAKGAKLKGGNEKVGPCPVCGGDDRFGVNSRKGKYYCRGSGFGGDVIALAQYIEKCNFLTACELLTGRPPPRGDSHVDLAALARAAEERRAKALQREADARYWRERERRKLYAAYDNAHAPRGTPVEAYLARRKLALPRATALRFKERWRLYSDTKGGGQLQVLHEGPAMFAGITGPDGHFAGLHATWIDLDAADGKARIADPVTGELAPAKKVRGSASGGRIELVRCHLPETLVLGEGIEEVLTVWHALTQRGWDLARAAFWSSISLGNLGGKAVGTLRHPSAVNVDAAGRKRAVKIPSEEPDRTVPAIPIPDSVRELVLLGDGDSERFLTETTLRRAARRYARPGLTIRVVWSPEGSDWNTVLMEAAA